MPKNNHPCPPTAAAENMAQVDPQLAVSMWKDALAQNGLDNLSHIEPASFRMRFALSAGKKDGWQQGIDAVNAIEKDVIARANARAAAAVMRYFR